MESFQQHHRISSAQPDMGSRHRQPAGKLSGTAASHGLLDPDKIQEEMFLDSRVAALHNGLPSDHESYLHCLRSLSEHCLVRRDNATIRILRLVQQATIHRLEPTTDLPAAFHAAVNLIWTLFDGKSKNSLLVSSASHEAQDYLPHVEALVNRYTEFGRSIGYESLYLAELIFYCSG